MKQFMMNITIQVEANTADEALDVLMNEKSLEAIKRAIVANKENMKEICLENEEKTLIN